MSFPESDQQPFRLADMTSPQLGHPSTWPAAQQQPAPTYTPPQPARRSRKPLLLVAGAVALVVVLAAAAAVYFIAFSGVTVSGSLTVAGAGRGFGDGGECRGTGGYSDIAAGATVTITDASGKTIALGHLDPGKAAANNCIFPFSVSAPRSDFYGIEVSHRGVTKFSRAEAKAGVKLGLGF